MNSFSINADKTIMTFTGTGDGPDTAAIIQFNYALDVVAVKVAGHTAWTGRFTPREYIPVSYEVYKMAGITYRDNGTMDGTLERIIDFPVRS